MKNEIGGACSAYVRQEKCIQRFWWGNLRVTDHLEDRSIDGRIIFRWILGNWGYEMDRAGSEDRQVAGTCESGNESLGSIKCRQFLA
jgi:hypothetical protein